jgi:hypothetical protein
MRPFLFILNVFVRMPERLAYEGEKKLNSLSFWEEKSPHSSIIPRPPWDLIS